MVIAPLVAAQDVVLPIGGDGGQGQGEPGGDPIPPPKDPGKEAEKAVNDLPNRLPGAENPAPAPPGGGGVGDIGKDVAAALSENWFLTGAIAIALAGSGLVVFYLASRYVDPKQALENPQRSMLYGFVKGNPGVHLKQLSSEFRMKTSTVLWHIRKLECADLVRSKKANGYRVFYPVSGGLEARQLSTAITALSNDNARRIFEHVAVQPGTQQRDLAERLAINGGTVRWHLKKMRQAGLVAELSKDRASYYYSTELGVKAMRQVAGLPAGVEAPQLPFGAEHGDEALALN
jgi:predicted transcriptional regulator